MKFLRVYLWPILAILGYVILALALAWHGQAYVNGLAAFLQDPAFWAENTFTAIVFTVLISWVVGISAHHRDRMERAPYENWRLEVKDGGKTDAAGLSWDEIRRFRESPMEMRRFVQSVISSRGEQIDITRLDILKEATWVRMDEQGRKFVVDMDEFRASDDRKARQRRESGSEN